MTPSLAELQRKVRQNDNDIQAIYGMLSDISGTLRRHGNRFDELDAKLDAVTSKQDEQSEQLHQIVELLRDLNSDRRGGSS